MDPMDILGHMGVHETECQPALPDVDIDLLVGTGFNTPPSRPDDRDIELRMMVEEDLCPHDNLLQDRPFSNFEPMEDFSPRDISEDPQVQLDKEAILTYFIESRPEDLANPLVNINGDHTRAYSLASTGAETPIMEETRIVPETVMPQSLMEAERDDYTSHPAITQAAWQDLTTMLSNNVPTSMPSSIVQEMKMLPLETQIPDFPYTLNTSQLPEIGHESKSVRKTPRPTVQRTSAESASQPSSQQASLEYELPIAVPPAQSQRGNISVKVSKNPIKQTRKRGFKKKKEAVARSALKSSNGAGHAPLTTPKQKAAGRRKMSANAHLSLEERKKLRAERNRESAEKSRMRRKQMILDLETNVSELRDENKDLKAKVEEYHGVLKSASAEVSRMSSMSKEEDGKATDGMTQIPLLFEALSALQRCMEECPRTFNRNPQSPLIPLNVSRKRSVGPSS